MTEEKKRGKSGVVLSRLQSIESQQIETIVYLQRHSNVMWTGDTVLDILNTALNNLLDL